MRQWMKSPDLETMGAVFSLINKREHYERIFPPLQIGDYRAFSLRYYKDCITQDSDGEWHDSPYTAAHSLVNWFNHLWKSRGNSDVALVELKELLACLYVSGGERVRRCVVTGVLEHMLQDHEIKRFFLDWRRDPNLKTALTQAETPYL